MFEKKEKFHLLMRRSVDGYKGQIFLDKCKNKGKKITIMKADDGNVFGAFTDLNFNGCNSWTSRNKNSFLFAFLN